MLNKYGFEGKELKFFIEVKTLLINGKQEDELISEKVARIATIMLSNAIEHGKDYYRESLKVINRLYGGSPTIIAFVEKAKKVVKEYLYRLKELI